VSTFQGPNKFVALAPGDGTTLIRDSRTAPSWHDISTLAGYPVGVTGVSLTVMTGDPTTLRVTVNNAVGAVAETTCMVNPLPGTGGNPLWPGNCSAFTDISPP
jgi:hypothetical protein